MTHNMENAYTDLFRLSAVDRIFPPLSVLCDLISPDAFHPEQGEREEAVKRVVFKFRALWKYSFEEIVCEIN